MIRIREITNEHDVLLLRHDPNSRLMIIEPYGAGIVTEDSKPEVVCCELPCESPVQCEELPEAEMPFLHFKSKLLV